MPGQVHAGNSSEDLEATRRRRHSRRSLWFMLVCIALPWSFIVRFVEQRKAGWTMNWIFWPVDSAQTFEGAILPFVLLGLAVFVKVADVWLWQAPRLHAILAWIAFPLWTAGWWRALTEWDFFHKHGSCNGACHHSIAYPFVGLALAIVPTVHLFLGALVALPPAVQRHGPDAESARGHAPYLAVLSVLFGGLFAVTGLTLFGIARIMSCPECDGGDGSKPMRLAASIIGLAGLLLLWLGVIWRSRMRSEGPTGDARI